MESAYVLHTRPWRETSLIAELFTPGHGRVGVVARGARRGRRGAGSALQPFVRVRCDWRGRGELRTLTLAEAERTLWLVGRALYAGLYLNELLMRLLQREDAHPDLFALYARTLELLAAGGDAALEATLRRFEFGLLDDLGYGFPLDRDADGTELVAGADYLLEPDAGLVRVAGRVADGAGGAAAQSRRFAGAALLQLAAGALDAPDVLRVAKRLTRQALAPHLGPRPLRSRALFSRAATAGPDAAPDAQGADED